MRKLLNRLLWGFTFILAAVGIIGNAAGAWNYEIISWLTLFALISAIGLSSVIVYGVGIINTSMFLGGLFLAVSEMIDIFEGKIGIILLAIFFGVIGVCIVVPKRKRKSKSKLYKKNELCYETYDYSGKEFSGDYIEDNFGGAEIDLRNAIIEKDCVLDLRIKFGGVNIYLPENVNFDNKVKAFLGSVDDVRNRDEIENAPTVRIEGSVSLGGITIY